MRMPRGPLSSVHVLYSNNGQHPIGPAEHSKAAEKKTKTKKKQDELTKPA